MEIETLAVAFLAAIGVGGLAYVFIYPYLSGDVKGEQRRERLASSTPQRVERARAERNSRRNQIEETLKEFERKRSGTKSAPLNIRIQRAGLSITVRQFWMMSAGLGFAAFILLLGSGAAIGVAALGGFAAGLGVPRWGLSFLQTRREKAFIAEFANAVDVIVRGVKAGLPLGDCVRIIAQESQEPVKSEFRQIVESQALGISLADACLRLYERMPLQEANFFGIVVNIQQKAGGNLSETLANLSKVLRDRKKMKAKIQAMSMEAKASATIIAALPFAVMALVYLTSPKYIQLLWTTEMGHMMMIGSGIWMGLGVLVMRNMINFDF